METPPDDIEAAEALLQPGGLLKEMALLDEIAQNEETRQAETAAEIFSRLFRGSVVAAANSEVLIEFLRDPFWDGDTQKPKSGDREGILRGLIRFHVRNEEEGRARRKLHVWRSAGRELIARDVPASEVKAVIADTMNGISGLRDAFAERRKAALPTQKGSQSQTAAKFEMRLPVFKDRLSWRRFNKGERYLVYNDGGKNHYISESDLKSAPPEVERELYNIPCCTQSARRRHNQR